MSLFTKLGNEIASPVDAAGNPRAVENVDMQRWMTEVERAMLSFQAGGGIIFPDLATANASLAYTQNQMAWVIGDPVPANNGVYRKIGASGSGSWARLGDLPFSFIMATNAGAGTPDAIVATSSLPVPAADGAALISLNITTDNTGSPVTVTFNGGPVLTIKTMSGNDVAPSGLRAGMIVTGFKSDSTFRLVTDQASAAIQAAAEAAQAAAEAAAAAAGGTPPVADRTALKALDTSTKKAALIYGEGGRNGTFAFSEFVDLARAFADADEGVFVAVVDHPRTGFPASSWAPFQATVVEGSEISLEGVWSTDLIENDADNSHRIDLTWSFVASETYTLSCYAKLAAGSRNIRLGFPVAPTFENGSRNAIFDLVNGAVVSADAGLTANIEDLGDGLYRLSITASCAADGVDVASFINLYDGTDASYEGDGASGVRLFGVVIEQASSPSASTAWVRLGAWETLGAAAEWFGIVGDYDGSGGTDNCPAINRALLVVPHLVLGAASYRIADKIVVGRRRKLSGHSRLTTAIVADDLNTTFNLGASSIVELQPGSPAGSVEDFKVVGVQDRTETVRVNLIQYPPAIDMTDAPRASVKRLRLVGVIDGIRALGNPGGAFIDEIESGALGCGIEIDGALDFLHIGTIHQWPFDVSDTPLYTSIWRDGDTYAGKIGRADNLDANSFTCYQSKLQLSGAGHAVTGRGIIARQISRVALDGGLAAILHNGLTTQIGMVYSTTADAPAAAVLSAGGLLDIASWHIDADGSNPIISVGGGTVLIHGGDARGLAAGTPLAQVSGGFLGLYNMRLLPAQARTISFIRQTGGILQVKGCSAPNGDGSAIVGVNADHVENDISGNSFPGWSVSAPGNLGNYGPNRAARRSHTSTMSSTSGTITTPGTVTMSYAVKGDEVEVACNWAITTNGTGAGGLRFTLPFTAAAESYGRGRKTAGGSEESAVRTEVSAASCLVYNADSTYPGADGAQGRFSLTYRIR